MFSESRNRGRVTPAELFIVCVVLVTIVTVILPGYNRHTAEARSLVKDSDVKIIASAYEGIENPEENRPVDVLERAGFEMIVIVPELAPDSLLAEQVEQDDGRIKVPRTVWVYASDLEGLWKDVRSASYDKY